MENSNYLIIIAIKEGDNFPLVETWSSQQSQQSHHEHVSLIIEARFNDELLRSDALPFNDSRPQLQTELAWQIDRKSLHLFRIERKPIKLQVFIESQKERHLVGYMILDLRNSQDTLDPKFEWKTLLNPKYKGPSHHRPQLAIALVLTKCQDDDNVDEIDDDQVDGVDEIVLDDVDENVKDNLKNNKEPSDNNVLKKSKSIKFPVKNHKNTLSSNGGDFGGVLSKSSSKESFTSQLLEYDLNVKLKNGYYHIWDSRHTSEKDCTGKYLISLVIAFASNIRKLFSSSQQIDKGKPFHFRYSFLGKLIKTDEFYDIDTCDFSIDQTTFKIATTSFSILRVYFELHPTVEIQLCDKYDNLYGFVSIVLSSSFNQENSNEEIFDPIQGSFMLLPNDENIDIEEPFPVIGISLELVKDSSCSTRSENVKNVKNIKNVKTAKDVQNPKCSTKSENVQNPKSSTRFENVKDIRNFESIDDESFSLPNNTNVNDVGNIISKSKEAKISGSKYTSSSSLIHFCFAIDLRTISLTDERLQAINSCYLQFSYSFFGFTDSIKTHPCIKLPFNTEVIVPHGFCSFNFATSFEQLEKTFKNIPLIIEVVEKTSINNSIIIGTAKVDLFYVLKVEKTSDNKQTTNLNVPVLNEQDKQIAKIQIIMSLQNFGTTQVLAINKTATNSSNATNPTNVTNIKHLTNETMSTMTNIDDLLVEAALEIELWKDKQLTLFRDELKQKENEYTRKIEEKLIEREKDLDRKLTEVTQLENKLKQSITENEVKKNSLDSQENEIKLMKDDLKEKYQKLNNEISNAMVEIKSHYEDRLVQEKNKSKDIENEKRKLQERIYFLERKVKEKENKIRELEEHTLPCSKTKLSSTVDSSIKILKHNSPNKQLITGRARINGTTPPKTSVHNRSTSLDARNKTNQIFNNNNAKINPKIVGNNSKIVGKVINKRDNIKTTNTKTVANNKLEILKRLRTERDELIKKGLSKDDPIIKEVDLKLKKYL